MRHQYRCFLVSFKENFNPHFTKNETPEQDLSASKFILKKFSAVVLLNLEIFSACNFIKKRLCHKYFPANLKKFLRTVILQNRAASNDMILATFFCNFFFLNRNGFLLFLMFFRSPITTILVSTWNLFFITNVIF